MFFIRFVIALIVKPIVMTIDPLTIGLIGSAVSGLVSGLNTVK